MSETIKQSVGKNGKNAVEDVKIVQTRLNVYVAAKLLGARPPLAVDGAWAPTVPYIQDFQRLVLGKGNPDGRVDPLPGTTMTQLSKDPSPGLIETLAFHALVIGNIAQGPTGGIPNDLWEAGLKALLRFANHPKLARPHLITFVDFRLSRKIERLWAVDLKARQVLHYTLVAHGGGPKNSEGKPVDYQGDFAHRFEDGMKFSSLGSYITQNVYLSNLGHLSNKPAMKIIGLEGGINGRAQERGVVFHGADYVKPGAVGNSWGCFSTGPNANPPLVDDIKDGSFVFAYHSSYKSPAA